MASFIIKLSDDYYSKAKANEKLEELQAQGYKKLSVKRASNSFGKAYFSVWGDEMSRNRNKGETRKVRRNPVDELELATEVSSGFHGRKPLYVEDVIEIERYRTNLAHLGDLVELEILDNSGKHVIPINFAEHDSEEHVSVGSTPDRNQLIFSGGNQGIDLESFPELSDNEKYKDYVRIGEVFSISYFTDKHHLEGPKYQKDGTEYIHQFGEEQGGVRPELMYDRLNCRMILIGGSYEVRDEGIYN